MTMLGMKRKSKNGTEATNEIRSREPSGTVSSNTTSSKSRSSGHQEQDNRDVDMSHQVDHLVENTVMAWQQSSTNSYESRQHMEQLVLRSFFEKLQEIYRLTPSFTSSPSSSSSPNPSQGTPLLKLLVKSNSMAFPISAIEATTLKHNSYSSMSRSSDAQAPPEKRIDQVFMELYQQTLPVANADADAIDAENQKLQTDHFDLLLRQFIQQLNHEVSSLNTLFHGKIVMEGWLRKKGQQGVNLWRERYFMIRKPLYAESGPRILCYYRRKEEDTPRDHFIIHAHTIIDEVRESASKLETKTLYSFRIWNYSTIDSYSTQQAMKEKPGKRSIVHRSTFGATTSAASAAHDKSGSTTSNECSTTNAINTTTTNTNLDSLHVGSSPRASPFSPAPPPPEPPAAAPPLPDWHQLHARRNDEVKAVVDARARKHRRWVRTRRTRQAATTVSTAAATATATAAVVFTGGWAAAGLGLLGLGVTAAAAVWGRGSGGNGGTESGSGGTGSGSGNGGSGSGNGSGNGGTGSGNGERGTSSSSSSYLALAAESREVAESWRESLVGCVADQLVVAAATNQRGVAGMAAGQGQGQGLGLGPRQESVFPFRPSVSSWSSVGRMIPTWEDSVRTEQQSKQGTFHRGRLHRVASTGEMPRSMQKGLRSAIAWSEQATWQVYRFHQTLRIFKEESTAHSHRIPTLKTSLNVLHASPAQVFEQLMDVSSRYYHDNPVFESARVVATLDEHSDIIYLKLQPMPWMFPMGWWMAPRDVCLLRYWRREEDDSYVICYQSISHAKCPVRSDCVRANVMGGGFIIAPPRLDEKSQVPIERLLSPTPPRKCRVTQTCQMNPNFSFPWSWWLDVETYGVSFLEQILVFKGMMEDWSNPLPPKDAGVIQALKSPSHPVVG